MLSIMCADGIQEQFNSALAGVYYDKAFNTVVHQNGVEICINGKDQKSNRQGKQAKSLFHMTYLIQGSRR